MESVKAMPIQGASILSIKEGMGMNNQSATLEGAVHSLRAMAGFAFVLLRRYDGVLQCVVGEKEAAKLQEGCTLRVTGKIVPDERAPQGFELHAEAIGVLSRPKEALPAQIGKRGLSMGLEAELAMRPIALRNLKKRAIFKVQEGIVRGFREFLQGQGFTEIHSPKLGRSGAEGGANIFSLKYFGRDAVLAQSPQLYKQTMVSVYDRVFEVGPVFRAEKHATVRHLNEYTSLDFEMGYIESERDVMAMEAAMLKHMFALLRREYEKELSLLGAEVPELEEIPCISFTKAKEEVSRRYQRRIKDPYDLEPEEEKLIGQMVREETGSRLCFVSAYPSKKRPFYAMDDPEQPRFTKSFDLLFDGLEVTTGGQRIHDYDMQLKKMRERGMDPDEFSSFLMIHKYGMPPHGGLGIGLERLTMQLLSLPNIRYASLFPRDINRLEP